MPNRRLRKAATGVIVAAADVTANKVGDSTGLITTAAGVSWLSEPDVAYKLCTSAPTMATNVARSKVMCRWCISGANGTFTTNPTDLTGFQVIGEEHMLGILASTAYYGFSAFEYHLGTAGITPPTYYSFGFQFWHSHSNTSGFTSVAPTLKAATDWPFQLWVEKV